jgi:hypothetical protein
MFATQPWPVGSTGLIPQAARTHDTSSEDLVRLLLEPEPQRSRSYWMSMLGCLMISLSCLAVFAISAAQR